jgi:hypothetical protein
MRRMGDPANAWGDVDPDDRLWGSTPNPGGGPLARSSTHGLGIADLLDGAFRAVRPALPTLLAATAIVVTALTVVNLLALLAAGSWLAANLPMDGTLPDALQSSDTAGQAAALAIFAEGASRVLALAGTLLVSGALAPTLSAAALAGPAGPTGLRQLWAGLRPRFGTLAATAAAVAVILVLGSLLGAIPGFLLMSTGGDVGLLLGALLAAAGGFAGFLAVLLLWGVRLSLAPQAVTLEGRALRPALARSADLVRGRYWRVLGALAAATVITWVVQGLVSAPFATLSALVASSPGTDTRAVLGLTPGQLSITGLGVIVSTTVAFPVLAAVLTVLFDDLRRAPDGRLTS